MRLLNQYSSQFQYAITEIEMAHLERERRRRRRFVLDDGGKLTLITAVA
jgi:hypothetical protein